MAGVAYQVKGDIKQSDTSHRRQIIDKYELLVRYSF